MIKNQRHKRIRAAFENRAERYEAGAALQKVIASNLCAALPGPERAPRILEIGCGTGILSRLLVERYPQSCIDMTDVAPSMVEICENKLAGSHKHLRFFTLDAAQSEDIKEGAYDLIVGSMIVQWLEEPARALEHLRAKLARGGALYYSAPAQGSFPEWSEALSKLGLEAGTLAFPNWPGRFKSEEHILDYGSTWRFLTSLKEIGAHTPKDGYTPLTPGQIRKACALSDLAHRGRVSWRIAYGRLDKD